MASVDTIREHPTSEQNVSEEKRNASDYRKICDLGAGDYGTVIEVEDEKNQKFALKCIDMTSVPNANILAERETKPGFLHHPNIVKCYDFWTEETSVCVNGTMRNKTFLYILMELCQRDTLEDWIRTSSLEVRKYMSTGISFKGYLMLWNIYIHMDWSIPSNIFFGYDNRVKIADFGTVLNLKERNPNQFEKEKDRQKTSTAQKNTTSIGTLGYMAPEILSGVYDHRVDIFSIGVILLEMITPTHTPDEHSALFQRLMQFKFPESCDENFNAQFELFKRMLSYDPEDRPNIAAVKKIEFQCLTNKISDDIYGSDYFALLTQLNMRFEHKDVEYANANVKIQFCTENCWDGRIYENCRCRTYPVNFALTKSSPTRTFMNDEKCRFHGSVGARISTERPVSEMKVEVSIKNLRK